MAIAKAVIVISGGAIGADKLLDSIERAAARINDKAKKQSDNVTVVVFN